MDHLDAIVLSPLKFVGGPGASGLLVADRALFRISRPSAAGGGTVRFVTWDSHEYLDDVQAREEAGTPSIIGDIRAGFVMQLSRYQNGNHRTGGERCGRTHADILL